MPARKIIGLRIVIIFFIGRVAGGMITGIAVELGEGLAVFLFCRRTLDRFGAVAVTATEIWFVGETAFRQEELGPNKVAHRDGDAFAAWIGISWTHGERFLFANIASAFAFALGQGVSFRSNFETTWTDTAASRRAGKNLLVIVFLSPQAMIRNRFGNVILTFECARLSRQHAVAIHSRHELFLLPLAWGAWRRWHAPTQIGEK
jgi:hypothetical protein